MKPLSFFATVLAASGLCAVASAQTAAPVVFSLVVAGLSRDQVEASVQARRASPAARPTGDLI
jgi:hypothetical protein